MIPRARHLVAAALSALLMLPALVGTASAATDSRVYSVTLAKTVADMKKVAEYWRPDKLKKADSYSPATPASQSSPTATAAAGASRSSR